MRFNDAIDLYVRDMRSEGRINSDRTGLLVIALLWENC